MPSAKDLTGMRFGKLTALRTTKERQSGSIVWECQCDCGKIVKIKSHSLVGGNTKSCGCLNKEVATSRMLKKAAADCAEGTRLSYLTKTIFKNNTSGVRGVHLHKKSGKWIAEITFKKKSYYLGYFSNKEKAILARRIAERKLWEPLLEAKIGVYKNEEELKEKLHQYLKSKIDEELRETDLEGMVKPSE